MPAGGVNKPRRRGRRVAWVITLGIVLLLAVAGHLAIRLVLSTDFLRARFSEALSQASGGLYRFELGDVAFDLVLNKMHATGVAIYPDSAIITDTTRLVAPEALYSISAPSVTVEGTNLWALLSGHIKARTLRLSGPHLHLALDSRRARSRDTATFAGYEEPAAPADSLAASFHLRLARQLPRMTIGNLRIDSAAFSWDRRVGEERMRDSVGSIFVELIDIDTDSLSAADPSRVLFSDDVRFRVGGYSRLSADGYYLMSVDSVSGSTRDGVLSLRAVQFAPILSDSQFKTRLTHRTTRYKATARDLELSGVGFRGAFDASTINVRSMFVNQPELDVYLDKTLPSRGRTGRAVLPHQALQGISWNLTIDTVRVERGRIMYSERASDGARPGIIRFEEFAGELRRLSNNAPLDGERATLDMRARLNGAGILTARLDYDMMRRGLNMRYRGSISGMDAAAFNEVLVDLEGLKIESGRLDTAWFNINVVRDRATGDLQMLYHDLKVSFRDKDTGARGLLNRLKSFVANTFVVKGSNPPAAGKPATTARVDIQRSAEVPWFGFLWLGIRQGLMTTLGL